MWLCDGIDFYRDKIRQSASVLSTGFYLPLLSAIRRLFTKRVSTVGRRRLTYWKYRYCRKKYFTRVCLGKVFDMASKNEIKIAINKKIKLQASLFAILAIQKYKVQESEEAKMMCE